MNLRVYEMASEAERRLVDRQAERGWQVAQAEALRSRQSPLSARGITTLIGTALRRAGQFWKVDVAAKCSDIAPVTNEARVTEAGLSRSSLPQPSCAMGD